MAPRQTRKEKNAEKAEQDAAAGPTNLARVDQGPPAIIGLELGLANGRVACARDGKVEVVANEQGNRNTPACVAFTDEEQLLGEAAVSQQQRNARGTVVELRRLLGLAPDSAELSRWQPGWQFQLVAAADKGDKAGGGEGGKGGGEGEGEGEAEGEEGGDESASGVRVQLSVRGALKAYTPEFVASLLLKRLRSDAESYLNAPVKEAVLPLHAGTPPARAAALKRAALAAGLRATLVPSAIAVALGARGLVEIVAGEEDMLKQPPTPTTPSKTGAPEPPAADADGRLPPRSALVIEWGASHASATLVAIDGERVSILAQRNDEALATGAADAALLAYLLADVQRKTRVRLDDGEHKRGLSKLRDAAESARCSLSKTASTQLMLESLADEKDYTLQLSRPKLEELLASTVAKLIELALAVAEEGKARAGGRPLVAVVLAGGGCAMPRVQALARLAFPGASLLVESQPDETALVGCARLASIMMSHAALSSSGKGGKGVAHADGRPRMMHAPLSPHSISVVTASGSRVVVMPLGTPLPASRKLRIPTPADGETMRVTLYEEGAADDASDAGQQIGVARTLPGFSAAHELVLALGRDGTLTVSQRLQHHTGAPQHLQTETQNKNKQKTNKKS